MESLAELHKIDKDYYYFYMGLVYADKKDYGTAIDYYEKAEKYK